MRRTALEAFAFSYKLFLTHLGGHGRGRGGKTCLILQQMNLLLDRLGQGLGETGRQRRAVVAKMNISQ